MRKFSKDPDAMARLSPEQYRVTQQNGTEAAQVEIVVSQARSCSLLLPFAGGKPVR